MDHLPPPIDTVRHETVKFHIGGRQTFQPGDFFAIPMRHGYKDKNDLLDPDLLVNGLGDTVAESIVNQFLQEWLFFGLLSEVVGAQIKAEDFYDAETSNVSTDNLNGLLRTWAREARGESGRSVDERKSQYIRGSMALDYARRFVCKHLAYPSLDSKPHSGFKKHELKGIHARVDKKLSLSIAILGETLQKARPKLAPDLQDLAKFWTNPKADEESWGNSAFCRQKMIKRGWCLRDIRGIEATMPGVTGTYYASAIAALGSEIDHEEHGCTFWECNVQPTPLKPMHNCSCRSPENCRPLNIGLQELDIVKHLEMGKTPLLTYSRTTGQLEIQYHDLSLKTLGTLRFGALSHGWSEQIFDRGPDAGDGHSRRVYGCQLRSLQDGFNRLVRARCEEDSVPHVENGDIPFFIDVLCFPRKASKTAKAMRQLKTIYQKAEVVIVWDRNLLQQEQRGNEKIIEMNVRICTGGWSRRLWTLQEAVLADNLQFQFAGERCFLSIEDISKAMNTAKEKLEHPYHHVWRAGRPLGMAVEDLRRENVNDKVSRLWQAVQFRQCQTIEDECLILANILGEINVAEIEKLKGADLRMAKLLELIDLTPSLGIPSGIVFVPGPKLNKPGVQCAQGLQWAPKTWMSQQVHRHRVQRPLRKAAYLMKHGLAVQFPAIRLHLPLMAFIKSTFWIPTHQALNEWFKVKVDVDEEKWEHFYENQIQKADEPSIILSAYSPKEQWEVGILVASKGRLHAGDIRWVKILSRVWIRLETNTNIIYKMRDSFRQNQGWMAFGEMLSGEQRWCVDGGENASSKELA